MGTITAEPNPRTAAQSQRLAEGEEPPLAAHLTTPRGLYTHHGLYVGQGRVIHYAGLTRGLRRGPVEEVSLEQFAGGKGIWVDTARRSRFDAQSVIARARNRLGERSYRVLSNNCEHFCEWCLHGESRSPQLESLRAKPRAALLALPVALRALAARVADSRPRPRRSLTTAAGVSQAAA